MARSGFALLLMGLLGLVLPVGLAALQLGRPVMALGHALYGLPGLTYQGSLDAFWTAADLPDPILCADFARLPDLLAHGAQILILLCEHWRGCVRGC